jgi:hypothetical protein
MLQPTSIKASLEGSTLVARHEHYTTRIEVVPPESRVSETGPIRAVVRMTTEVPRQLSYWLDYAALKSFQMSWLKSEGRQKRVDCRP